MTIDEEKNLLWTDSGKDIIKRNIILYQRENKKHLP